MSSHSLAQARQTLPAAFATASAWLRRLDVTLRAPDAPHPAACRGAGPVRGDAGMAAARIAPLPVAAA
ncbi:hypothetical protein [Paracraurococcus ruber]|uniref:Uncharacterized protein n=1 Tax=Paracraurococcus ruber TaxID=77675 RepID=A0ABS1D697_9PROT|nr:hypothetical protein [Paracraurococcus ruber]MBK1661990.1 hypothetical protein [Paracraurococcus ruber]TDG27126.1 hypothetical protein E2C05_24010 [Paracraurococcus ruber]